MGHFYLDPYIRDDKAYAGADKGWYFPLKNRSKFGSTDVLGKFDNLLLSKIIIDLICQKMLMLSLHNIGTHILIYKVKINWSNLGTLVFALPQQNYGKPPLLNFNETKEVLRNFGKMLQHMLTENEYSETCGQASIEKDARGEKHVPFFASFFFFDGSLFFLNFFFLQILFKNLSLN